MNKPDQKSLNSPEALNRSYIAPEVVRQRQRTIESLDLRAGEQVLDIGCGTGFLSYEMALVVGEKGSIMAIDPEASMIEATKQRCAHLDYVNASVAEVGDIPSTDSQFDVVTCTQVLLYVAEVEKALQEMHRVLKPGGRIAVLETDWRGMVLSTRYPELTDRIAAAWDATVASPNLPPRLPKLLRNQGFNAVRCEAIPLLNTSFSTNSFSVNSIDWLAKTAYKHGSITKQEGEVWVDDLRTLGTQDDYFFCLNRFLFIAVK